MALAKEPKNPAITESAIIDVKVVIDNYNVRKDPDAPRMTRESLAEMIHIHIQSFTNWKNGVTPAVLNSIFDFIKFNQDAGVMDDLLKTWVPSEPPTIVDHIIKMMEISGCKIEEFVTRAGTEKK